MKIPAIRSDRTTDSDGARSCQGNAKLTNSRANRVADNNVIISIESQCRIAACGLGNCTGDSDIPRFEVAGANRVNHNIGSTVQRSINPAITNFG